MTDKLRHRRRPKPPKIADQTPPLSKSDQAALAAFCDQIQVDEMSQESWETCMSELDVKIPLFLAASEASAGGEREVKFSRQVRQSAGAKPLRDPLRIKVTVPPQAFDGLELRQKGHGDGIGERFGDLVIIVRIKRGS